MGVEGKGRGGKGEGRGGGFRQILTEHDSRWMEEGGGNRGSSQFYEILDEGGKGGGGVISHFLLFDFFSICGILEGVRERGGRRAEKCGSVLL